MYNTINIRTPPKQNNPSKIQLHISRNSSPTTHPPTQTQHIKRPHTLTTQNQTIANTKPKHQQHPTNPTNMSASATLSRSYPPAGAQPHNGPILRLIAKVTLPTDPPTALQRGVSAQDIYTIIRDTTRIHCTTNANPYATFKPHHVEFSKTQPSKKRSDPDGTYINLYKISIIPSDDTSDTFDTQLFRDQVTTMVLQKWVHRHPHELDSPDIHPPSPNPWAPHTELLLPACNSFDETARGILLGSLSPNYHGSSRRATDAITEILHERLLPTLQTNSDTTAQSILTLDDFRDNVGIRVSDFKNNTNAPTRHRAYFLCTSTQAIFDTIANSVDTSLKIYNAWIRIATFPDDRTSREKVTAVLNRYMRFFLDDSKVMKLEHFPLRTLQTLRDHDDFVRLTPLLITYAPQFTPDCSEPMSYNICFKPDQTIALDRTLRHIIPDSFRRPASPTTPNSYATAAAKPSLKTRQTAILDELLDADLNTWHTAASSPQPEDADTIPQPTPSPAKRHRSDSDSDTHAHPRERRERTHHNPTNQTQNHTTTDDSNKRTTWDLYDDEETDTNIRTSPTHHDEPHPNQPSEPNNDPPMAHSPGDDNRDYDLQHHIDTLIETYENDKLADITKLLSRHGIRLQTDDKPNINTFAKTLRHKIEAIQNTHNNAITNGINEILHLNGLPPDAAHYRSWEDFPCADENPLESTTSNNHNSQDTDKHASDASTTLSQSSHDSDDNTYNLDDDTNMTDSQDPSQLSNCVNESQPTNRSAVSRLNPDNIPNITPATYEHYQTLYDRVPAHKQEAFVSLTHLLTPDQLLPTTYRTLHPQPTNTTKHCTTASLHTNKKLLPSRTS